MLVLAQGSQGLNIGELIDSLIRNDAFWIFVLSSVLIPLVNAALTRVSTTPIFKSGLTMILAGLVAVGSWIANVGGVVDNWKAAVGVFITAVLGAGGIHAAVTKGAVSDAISNAVPINLGPKMTPEKAIKKHGSPNTMPVPAGVIPIVPDPVPNPDAKPAGNG